MIDWLLKKSVHGPWTSNLTWVAPYKSGQKRLSYNALFDHLVTFLGRGTRLIVRGYQKYKKCIYEKDN